MKIGIIGGGISGLYLAYLLRDTNHEIIVFEKNNTLGGRISSLKTENMQVDQGAEYYIEDNKYLRALIYELGLEEEEYLSQRFLIDLKSGKGTYLKSKTDNFFQKLVKSIQLMNRFKFKGIMSLGKLNKLSSTINTEITEFYTVIENSTAENLFVNLYKLFSPQGTLDISSLEYLSELGISENIIWGFVNPLIRNVYMTEVDELPAYLVQLLLSLKDKKLFHLKDGNEVLIEKLRTELSLAKNVSIHTGSEVSDIMLSPTDDLVIRVKQGDINIIHKDIDFLYISGPFTSFSSILFSQFGSQFMNYFDYISDIQYTQLFHHFAEVRFRDSNLEQAALKGADSIIPSDRICSIWEINIIAKGTDTWFVDITSPYDLERIKINDIFSGFRPIHSKDWKSGYPNYGKLKEFDFPKNHFPHPRIYAGTDNLIATLESSVIQAVKCAQYIQTQKKIII